MSLEVKVAARITALETELKELDAIHKTEVTPIVHKGAFLAARANRADKISHIRTVLQELYDLIAVEVEPVKPKTSTLIKRANGKYILHEVLNRLKDVEKKSVLQVNTPFVSKEDVLGMVDMVSTYKVDVLIFDELDDMSEGALEGLGEVIGKLNEHVDVIGFYVVSSETDEIPANVHN